jgi:hypothetical protein
MSCGTVGSCRGDTAPTRAFASSEGSRIANLLESSRACMAAEALAKARAFSSGKACAGGSCKVPQLSTLAPAPPPPSILLSANQGCYTYNDPARWGTPVPESVRIANIQQRTIDESTNPYDPDARFSAYARKFLTPCPPDPAWYKNAGEPILQGKNCPLPNNPQNPVLPG